MQMDELLADSRVLQLFETADKQNKNKTKQQQNGLK